MTTTTMAWIAERIVSNPNNISHEDCSVKINENFLRVNRRQYLPVEVMNDREYFIIDDANYYLPAGTTVVGTTVRNSDGTYTHTYMPVAVNENGVNFTESYPIPESPLVLDEIMPDISLKTWLDDFSDRQSKYLKDLIYPTTFEDSSMDMVLEA